MEGEIKYVICKGPCGRTLPLNKDNFYFKPATPKRKSYPSAYCISCNNLKNAKYRRDRYANPETQKLIKSQNHSFRSKPERKEFDKIRNHENYIKNSESIKNRIKVYRSDPKNKKWRIKYQAERNERRDLFKNRYHSDPEFRLRGSIRKRIWESLRSTGSNKNRSILEVLPYSLEKLVWHLEKQFEPGMSWEDSSSFCIDHIIPQVMFPISDVNDENVKLCWSLNNLRPLTPNKNYSDGSRSSKFLGAKNFSDLLEIIRGWDLFSLNETDCGNTFSILSECEIDGDNLPISPIGLDTLDNIFLNRFDANTIGSVSLKKAMTDDHILLKVVTYMIKNDIELNPRSFLRNLKFYVRTPSHFFPSAASAIIKRYSTKGRIFDPFLGWGGRTLGAISAGASYICGTDLQIESVNNCKKICDKFSSYSNYSYNFINDDFSSYMKNCNDEFDIIITSPPFMNMEKYGDFSKKFSNIKDWENTILSPLALYGKNILSENGFFAIHSQNLPSLKMTESVLSVFSSYGYSIDSKFMYRKKSDQSVYVFRK